MKIELIILLLLKALESPKLTRALEGKEIKEIILKDLGDKYLTNIVTKE